MKKIDIYSIGMFGLYLFMVSAFALIVLFLVYVWVDIIPILPLKITITTFITGLVLFVLPAFKDSW